jgi:hypothetical protein
MATLYLSAPEEKSQGGSGFYRDFYTILQSGVGPDYAIYASLIGQVRAGISVVVFDRNRRLRAEGVVFAVTPKPSNRVQRYDVEIRGLATVSYTNPPSVNRCGVAVLP